MDFIDNLVQYGFSKTSIDTSSYPTLRQIFSENKCQDDVYACAPLYRNVLIFKLNNKITGKAKICFDCNKYYIEGSSIETDSFGQCGDFAKLYELLNYKPVNQKNAY